MKKFKTDTKRNAILINSISFSMIYKIFAIALTFFIIPLLIKGLGVERYGVWITIFSVFGWIYTLDMGIGNGVKNNLTICILNKKIDEANKYITTSYVCLFLIALIFFVVLSIIINSVDLKIFLNTSLDEWYLKTVFMTTLISFLFVFVLSIYRQFFYSVQKSSKVDLSLLLNNILIFIQFYIVTTFFTTSLLLVTIIYGVSNILVSLLFSYLFFKGEKELNFSFKNFEKSKIKEITGIGIEFFIIQICLIIILTTDNLIITYLLGSTEVTAYNNVFKIFQTYLIGTTIIFTPLWALYTEAYSNKDYHWIIQIVKKLNLLFVLLILAVSLTIIYAKDILFLWIKEDIYYDQRLILFMGVFILVRVYGEIYIYFLNGIGKIRLQLILFLIGAIINIPLSILFVNVFKMGSSGVILATIISLLSFVFAMPMQTYLILKKNKKENNE